MKTVKSYFPSLWGNNSEAYPLDYCEAAPKAVNLTVDEELLSGCRWLHIVKTTGGGAFICNILAVWWKRRKMEKFNINKYVTTKP